MHRWRSSVGSLVARGSGLALAVTTMACTPPVLPGSSTPAAVGARDEHAEAAVAQGLDDFHDAASKADEERYFAHFAKDGVFLGTDASERWDVEAFRAYAHPHFAKKKAWSFRATSRHVVVAPGGTVAWFDEELDTPNLGPARGSGVLVRDAASDGAWRIALYNLTITVPNDRFGEVKKLIAAPPPRTAIP